MRFNPRARTWGAAVAVALLAATAAHAGLGDRLRRAATKGHRIVGTALTMPIAVSAESMETEVYVFSTTLGRAIQRIRFNGNDAGRANKKIQLGSTIVVLDGTLLPSEGTRVVMARSWRARTEGNPLRRDFLIKYRSQILAYALREKPEEMRTVFHGDLGALRQITVDVGDMAGSIDSVLGVEHEEEVEVEDLSASELVEARQAKADLADCAWALRDAGTATTRLEAVIQTLPESPAKPVLVGAAAGVQQIINEFFDERSEQ